MIVGIIASQATGGGGGSEPPPEATATWDSGNKHANITLSNGDLTATNTATNAARMVKATASRNTGKYYFEARWDAIGDDEFTAIGFAISGTPLTHFLAEQGGSNWSAGYYPDGNVYTGPGFGSNVNTGQPLTVGEWARIAIDLDAGKAWVGDFTGWEGDPEAGTGESISFSLGGAMVFPAWNGYSNADAITANFGATAYAYMAPAGFSNWPDV